MPAAFAPTPTSTPRRQNASTSSGIRRCGTRARAREGTKPASHLPWEGRTLTPKLAGTGRCRVPPGRRSISLTMRPIEVFCGCPRLRLGQRGRWGKGRSSMRTRSFGWSVIALSALAASGCSTTPSPQIEASGPPEPEIPAHVRPTEIVGRWGYAAYHKPEDRARTEANARGQCKQPYVIGQGTNGGVMMYLADSSQLQELRLKGSSTGKDYIGPAGRTPGKDDREILSFDGRVMILKYVDPEVDGRYGTGIFVRCAPRAAQANAAAARPAQANAAPR